MQATLPLDPLCEGDDSEIRLSDLVQQLGKRSAKNLSMAHINIHSLTKKMDDLGY